MTLQEIFKEIEGLTPEEQAQLREYLNNLHLQSIKAKIEALNQAFDELREGLSQEELDEIVEAMNSEYISF